METLIITEDYWALEERDPPYTVGEVKARYGRPDAVLKHEHSSEMVYSNAGVSFKIYSDSDDDTSVWEMFVKPPFRLKTKEGFVLGKSTPRDAERIWGEINWYNRADFPEYSFFRVHDARFLVPKPATGFDEEVLRDTPVEQIMLFYSGLKRLEYTPPSPVEIKADANVLKTPPDSIEGYLERVFIERLDLDLDAHQDPDWNPLWDNFANRPFDKQFSSLSNRDWFENRKRFEAELLKRAEEGKYDVASLQQIFDAIRPEPDGRTAWIPVCAFLAAKSGEPVWILITKWEHAGLAQLLRLKDEREEVDGEAFEPDGEKMWMRMGHIRIEVFRVSDGELVDAIQCM